MGDFFTGQAIWFTVPAIFGTLAFVVRLFLLGAGGDDGHGGGGHGADVGTHGDVMGATDAMHDSADNLSGFFSVQSFLSFFMGFGWGGLGALKGLGWPWWSAVLLGLVAGLAMVLLLAAVMRNVRRLEATLASWLTELLAQANAKAALVAEGLGVKVLGVHSFSEERWDPDRPPPITVRHEVMDGAGPPMAGYPMRRSMGGSGALAFEMAHSKKVRLVVRVDYRVGPRAQ